MNKKIQSSIFLILCAIIWGTAFVAQRTGMEDMGPMYFNAFRMFIGGIVLVPIALITDRLQENSRLKAGQKPRSLEEKNLEKKNVMKGGIACGTIMFGAAGLQQIGLVSTNAGKSAFITTLYIVLVPLLALFIKHKPNINNWIGVVIAVIGLYFLCISNSFTIASGDFIILIGAFFWAMHILVTDHFAPKVNVSKLVCVQSFVSGIISIAVAFFVESVTWDNFIATLPSLLYVGVMSTGIAFTLQALGQKDANPTVASIILSTESLFAAVAGFLILDEIFTTRELVGCILLFIAVIIAQLPTKKERMKKAS